MKSSSSATDFAVAERIGHFTTDQLPLAALLVSKGWHPQLIGLASGKILFDFWSSDALMAEVRAFHAGEALVNPARFDAARIALRRQMDRALAGRGQ